MGKVEVAFGFLANRHLRTVLNPKIGGNSTVRISPVTHDLLYFTSKYPLLNTERDPLVLSALPPRPRRPASTQARLVRPASAAGCSAATEEKGATTTP